MKLYYAPGACSMAPHIVAREAGHTFDLERVDIPNKKTADGGDYWKINPKGYVPALVLDDGQVLTEVAVICQYLGDQKPQAGLVPQSGTMERYRLMEALNFASSEVHKQIGALFNPNLTAEMKEVRLGVIGRRLDALEKLLDGNQFITGDKYTVADAYLFTVLNWTNIHKIGRANGRTSRHTRLESVQGRRCRKPCGRKVCWDRHGVTDRKKHPPSPPHLLLSTMDIALLPPPPFLPSLAPPSPLPSPPPFPAAPAGRRAFRH